MAWEKRKPIDINNHTFSITGMHRVPDGSVMEFFLLDFTEGVRLQVNGVETFEGYCIDELEGLEGVFFSTYIVDTKCRITKVSQADIDEQSELVMFKYKLTDTLFVEGGSTAKVSSIPFDFSKE